MAFKFTWKTNLVLNIFVFIIAFIFRIEIYETTLNFYINFPIIMNFNFNFFLCSLFLLICICIVHELFHGLAYIIFGGKIKFGFKLLYLCPYTRETSGLQLNRNQFLIVLLAPLIAITILSFILPFWFRNMAILFNAMGSSGDLLMAAIVLIQKKKCKIIDRKYGFDIIN